MALKEKGARSALDFRRNSSWVSVPLHFERIVFYGNYSSMNRKSKHVKGEFKCDVDGCGKVLSYSENLRKHKKRAHASGSLKCLVCGLKFEDEHSLALHRKRHDGIKPYKCLDDDCDKAFEYKSQLTRHKKTHIHVCEKDDCGSTHATHGELRRHLAERHKEDRYVSCPDCGFVPSDPKFLFEHMSSHSKLDPFACSVCDRKYKYKKNLDQHIRAAHESKKHPCEFCLKVLSTKQKLKFHVASFHSGNDSKPIPVPKKEKKRKRATLMQVLCGLDAPFSASGEDPVPKEESRRDGNRGVTPAIKTENEDECFSTPAINIVASASEHERLQKEDSSDRIKISRQPGELMSDAPVFNPQRNDAELILTSEESVMTQLKYHTPPKKKQRLKEMTVRCLLNIGPKLLQLNTLKAVPFVKCSFNSPRKSKQSPHPELNVREKKKKTPPSSPYVTLLDTNNEISVVTLESAEKIADHKSLRLVREAGNASEGQRDTYRLVHAHDYFKKVQKSRLKNIGLKGEKAAGIKSHISEHDLKPRLHQLQEWCRKGYQVKVAIDKCNDMQRTNEIFADIEKNVTEVGVISQKQETKSGIRFILTPKAVQEKPPES
ncbi:unnamed protein product [Notodromas monacha]|uniref:C2H2-type domain-containing protein n=1 Tax=Notodromas monacha TaxID=399045 RepID=A0A7R9GC16_9CRUS|nr:unnamed protein product [Notodromas monacha]CAG0916999.1 unnamed protein product [Notodromas monacha]